MGFIRRHTLEERAFATIGGGLFLLEFYCRFYSVELGTVYTDAVSFVTASVCNRISFDAVTPFVYTALVEFVIRTGSF